MSHIPELVYAGRAELAEGPVWHAGALWWVDILAGTLNRLEPATGLNTSRGLGAFVGAAVPTSDGRWLVARQYDCELVVNVQGDEPLLRPEMIDQLVAGMEQDPAAQMGTLARAIESAEVWANPNVVKVLFGTTGNALYFSRCSVPYSPDASGGFVRGAAHKHIGIYAYRRAFLLRFVAWPQSPLEQTEKLEQLRALENGVTIKVFVTPYDSIGVDRPEDVELVEDILRKQP